MHVLLPIHVVAGGLAMVLGAAHFELLGRIQKGSGSAAQG
jgi:hypothetical protein